MDHFAGKSADCAGHGEPAVGSIHSVKVIVARRPNFGKTGELPTHPELLDWLASEFVLKAGG